METNQPLFSLQIDDISNSYLTETARWAKFLAIVGFVLCAIVVLGGVFAAFFAGSVMFGRGGSDEINSAFAGVAGGAMLIFYILIAILYFLPCLYLYRFAGRMQEALRVNDQGLLNSSFENLKSCFKFIGILTVVLVSIYALVLVFAVIAALFAK